MLQCYQVSALLTNNLCRYNLLFHKHVLQALRVIVVKGDKSCKCYKLWSFWITSTLNTTCVYDFVMLEFI